MKTFFVTGTNTDVGKTAVSCALLFKLKSLAYSTLAMKPIAAGCELVSEQFKNEDALLLQSVMTAKLPYAQINPVAFEQAIAPHIAAQKEHVEINVELLLASTKELQRREEDIFLVEGAGGWLVPLNETQLLCELPVRLKMDVVLVVDMRLGCLNHALLSYQSIKSMGLNVCGWVANQTSETTMPVYHENLETLEQLIDAPCLARIPFIKGASAELLSEYINTESLISMCDKL